ncbi:right-handed parallel beta-helix repeat-containing protein [Methylocapsa palsarum]|uniref:Right handed beta helix region n=1 Tax=Methylocapsa palsarum TaxID=1612308 RepID=A0A1I3XF25_9HYPH|nr:right-handed parallel beta-helix repeat-containing protein [Methylocapsa palsarum]SFK17691.1 Right handed beta helix region [Methylocapsa palsarum]
MLIARHAIAYLAIGCLAIACLALQPVAASAQEKDARPSPGVPKADVYVSPSGSDACNGSRAGPGKDGFPNCPVATLDKARAIIRAKISANPAASYLVLLRGGHYFQTGPVVFNTLDKVADAGANGAPQTNYVTYAQYLSEVPVIDGGRLVTGWTVRPDGVWTAKAPGTFPATGANAANYFAYMWAEGPAGEHRIWHPVRPQRGDHDWFHVESAQPATYGAGVQVSQSAAFNAFSPNITVENGFAFCGGTRVRFGGAPPAPFVAGKPYLSMNCPTNNTLQLREEGSSARIIPQASGSAPIYYDEVRALYYGDESNPIPRVNVFGVNAGGNCAAISGSADTVSSPAFTVSRMSGAAPFDAKMTQITIAGVSYTIASVLDDSHLVVTSDPGVQKGAAFSSAPSAEACASWPLTGDEKIELGNIGRHVYPVAHISGQAVTLTSHSFAAVDSSQHNVLIAGSPWRRMNFETDCCAPGEMYLNRKTGALTYRPLAGETPANTTIYAPYAKSLVRISNSRNDGSPVSASALAGNLRFSGLQFKHTNTSVFTREVSPMGATGGMSDGMAAAYIGYPAFALLGSHNVVVDHAVFSGLSEGAFAGVLGSNYWTISNSTFRDIGTYGVLGGGGYSQYVDGTFRGGDLPQTPFWKHYAEQAYGANNVNDGHFTISNNRFEQTGVLQSGPASIALLAWDHATVTHNSVIDAARWAYVLGISVIDNSMARIETRSGVFTYNRADDCGTERTIYGLRVPGAGLSSDFGCWYSAGSLGGDNVTPSHRTVEHHNVINGAWSSKWPTTQSGSLTPTGFDGVSCYFDLNTSFGIDFYQNICSGSQNRMLQWTGMWNDSFHDNIFYANYTRGLQATGREPRVGNLIMLPAKQFTTAGTYSGVQPWAVFQKNIVSFNMNDPAKPAWVDGWGAIAGNPANLGKNWSPREISTASNLYYRADAPLTHFGQSTPFEAWQAAPDEHTGATQDIGSIVQKDPNFADTSWRSHQLFKSSPSEGSVLCADRTHGEQYSPACALPGASASPETGFMLWDPTTAGAH